MGESDDLQKRQKELRKSSIFSGILQNVGFSNIMFFNLTVRSLSLNIAACTTGSNRKSDLYEIKRWKLQPTNGWASAIIFLRRISTQNENVFGSLGDCMKRLQWAITSTEMQWFHQMNLKLNQMVTETRRNCDNASRRGDEMNVICSHYFFTDLQLMLKSKTYAIIM